MLYPIWLLYAPWAWAFYPWVYVLAPMRRLAPQTGAQVSPVLGPRTEQARAGGCVNSPITDLAEWRRTHDR